MRTNDTQFNYLFEKIYELVELDIDFEVDDEDLLEATKAVIDNLELDERFYHKPQPLNCNPIEYSNKMENYLNLFEHIPEDEHNHISNKIWEALDRAGIELSQDAELSIRIYDDEYEGEYDGQEYDE